MSNFQQNETRRSNDPQQDPAAPDKADLPSTMAVRSMLQSGVTDPNAYATYLVAHPGARNEILALLHQLLGNAFAAEVMREARDLAAKPTVGKPPGPEAREAAMQDAREVN